MTTYRVTWDTWPPAAREPKRSVAYHTDPAMAREQFTGLRKLLPPDDVQCPAVAGKGPCGEHVWHILADQRDTVASEWEPAKLEGSPDTT